MQFSDNLKKLRKEHNLTQEEVASKIYVSRSLIAKYENGSVYPTNENIEKLALLFGVEVSDLVGINESTSLFLKINKEQKIIIYIANIFILIISVLNLLFLFLPIFKGYKYEYPIPEGQTQPNRVIYFTSIFISNISNTNCIVIFSLIISIVCITLSVLSFFYLNKSKTIIIRAINYILFVVLLFLILASIITCLSYIS